LDATSSGGRFSIIAYNRQRDYDERNLRTEDLLDEPNGVCACFVKKHLIREFKSHTLVQLKALCEVCDVKVGKNRKEIVMSLHAHFNHKIRLGVKESDVPPRQKTIHDPHLSDLIRIEEAALGEEPGLDDDYCPPEDELSDDDFNDDPNGYPDVERRAVGNQKQMFCGVYYENHLDYVSFIMKINWNEMGIYSF
jgi:hypothetical protein